MTKAAIMGFTYDELSAISDALWSMEAERCLDPAGYSAASKVADGMVALEQA